MNLHTLSPVDGSRKKQIRVGRGIGSGIGKTSGRGAKGQWSRSGGGVRPGFEGGQMPLYRRLPKRGFTNIFKKEYIIINIEELNAFDDETVVNADLLLECGLIRYFADNYGLKVLGCGTLEKKLTVVANKFSQSAKDAIEKAGGKAELITTAAATAE